MKNIHNTHKTVISKRTRHINKKRELSPNFFSLFVTKTGDKLIIVLLSGLDMERLLNLFYEIYNCGGEVNVLNVFVKSKNPDKVLKSILEKLYICKTFEQLKKTFPAIDMNMVSYIKTYSRNISMEEPGMVIFNPDVYLNLSIPEVSENIAYKVESSSDNTSKVVDYIHNHKTFLSNIVNKSNKKKKGVSVSIAREKLFQIEKLYLKQVVKENIEPVIVKKNIQNNISITNEQITTSLRFMLPNTLAICLKDKSYIYTNKIIVSDSNTCGDMVFGSMKEKVSFLFDMYSAFFEDITTLEMFFGITTKFNNSENIKRNTLLPSLSTNISISPSIISMKYLRDVEQFRVARKEIEDAICKEKSVNNYLSTLPSSEILQYTNDNIDHIFDLCFS